MSVFANETGAEILKAVRAPEFIFPTLLMPCAFYALFAIVLSNSGSNATYLLATYGVFAVMGPSIFGFGVGVSTERERGWLQLKRAGPAPAYAYIGAKLVTTLLFVMLALIPVYLIAGFAGGVALARGTWFALFAIHLAATVPFVLIGINLGFTLGSSGAVAISNIVFLGLAVLGGLWFPVFAFPSAMQTLATFTPSFHLAELALAVVGAPGERTSSTNALTISIMTLSLLVLSLWTWSRQKQ